MGIWWSPPVQRVPAACADVGDIEPDEVPPARFGPIMAAFAVGSSGQRRCRGEYGPSVIYAGR
jgi:hypothetical protein